MASFGWHQSWALTEAAAQCPPLHDSLKLYQLRCFPIVSSGTCGIPVVLGPPPGVRRLQSPTARYCALGALNTWCWAGSSNVLIVEILKFWKWEFRGKTTLILRVRILYTFIRARPKRCGQATRKPGTEIETAVQESESKTMSKWRNLSNRSRSFQQNFYIPDVFNFQWFLEPTRNRIW